MCRTVLALTVAALASFATAVHADDGATSGSTVALPRVSHLLVALGMPDLVRLPHRLVTPADVRGKGTVGEDCHADEGYNHIYIGKYKEVFGKLKCCSATGECIDCRKDDKSFPPKSSCIDGKGR